MVGDRVKIHTNSGGAPAFVGTVERVDPMRTTLRSDQDLPTVIPNKVSPPPLAVIDPAPLPPGGARRNHLRHSPQ